MANKTISFIVPVHNEEDYVIPCLDSIFKLDTIGYNKELIVVDDGSTDRTSSLLLQYSQNHQFKIITQTNKGPGAARNAGMAAAAGEYIYFVDSDDRLLDADVQDILAYMDKRVDIIGINILRTSENGVISDYRIFSPNYNHIYTPAGEFVRKRNFISCVCAYFYRLAFLKSAGLYFYEGIYHEDEDFSPRTFAMASNFVAVDIDLYEYFERKNSITTSPNKELQQKRLRDRIKVVENLNLFISKDQRCHDVIAYKLDYLAVDTLRLLIRQHHNKRFREEIVAGLRRQNLFPLKWHWNFKYATFNLFTRIWM